MSRARFFTANSSSPQISASAEALAAGILLSFAAALVDLVEHFAHVLDLRKQRRGNVNRFFLRCGDGEAIAGARVHLDNFSRDLVLLLQNQARKIGGIFQIRDDDALDGDAEALENPVDEIVRERTLLRNLF